MRISDGMRTEIIDPAHFTKEFVEQYPEKIVRVCASGNVTIRVHEADDALPCGLVLFDDHVAIGLFHTTKTLETIIDTWLLYR